MVGKVTQKRGTSAIAHSPVIPFERVPLHLRLGVDAGDRSPG